MASEIDSIETSEVKASKFQKPCRAFIHLIKQNDIDIPFVILLVLPTKARILCLDSL
jgi:hypothetical protein